MNTGPQYPSGGHPGQGGRRRRRRGRGPASRPGHPSKQPRGGSHQASVFTGPMDHSYRNLGEGGPRNGRGFRGGRQQAPPKFFQHPEIEPLPANENAQPRIFAFVDDLFFLAKIQETARKLNVKVEFVKSDGELFDKLGQNGVEGKPSLIIFDLNSVAAKPLATIPKLKTKLKKDTTVIGFLSHLQGDLKVKAQEAGCDMVLPRSAFSSNLPQLLRRHAVTEDELEQ